MAAIPEFDHLDVVLVSTRNPLNVGAAARAMSNFGVARLRVVNPFPAAFREARSAVGAAAVLASAQEFRTVAEAVSDCTLVIGTTAVRHRQLQHPIRRLADGARLIRGELRSGRVALLFGSEKVGLSNDDLSHCHWLLHIPTRTEHLSMNLGQAVAVCLYELVRNTQGVRLPEWPKARAATGQVDRLTTVLLQALRASGYLGDRPSAAAAQKVRRLVRRLNVGKDDAEVWLGMLRQILWKLGSSR